MSFNPKSSVLWCCDTGLKIFTNVLLWLSISTHLLSGQTTDIETAPHYLFVNGYWYLGDGFQAKTMNSCDGILRRECISAIDSVIDLAGGYVIPPFAEAHTHRPANPEWFDKSNSFFLSAGIFYIMNQGNLARYYSGFHTRTMQHGTIDALFANALLGSSQSHGVDLWQRLVSRGSFQGVTAGDIEGDAYFIIESTEELEGKWKSILETNPDFIKVMVEHSEAYPERRNDPEYFGRSGIDPALLPDIVRLAQKAGLRVSAHIETAADFQLVVAAGVDLIAHLPGHDIAPDEEMAPYRIEMSDALLAAEKNIAVVTTTLLSADRADGDTTKLRRMESNHVRNMKLLSAAGVRLAAGSDQYSQHAVDEVMYLASLNIFENRMLLDMLCCITPQVIFHERKIGSLNSGNEASFLVLGGNPLIELDHVSNINLMLKNGWLLDSF